MKICLTAVKKLKGLNCDVKVATEAIQKGMDYFWDFPSDGTPQYKFGMKVVAGARISLFNGEFLDPIEKKYLGMNQDYDLADGVYSHMIGFKVGPTGNKDMPDIKYFEVKAGEMKEINIEDVLKQF